MVEVRQASGAAERSTLAIVCQRQSQERPERHGATGRHEGKEWLSFRNSTECAETVAAHFAKPQLQSKVTLWASKQFPCVAASARNNILPSATENARLGLTLKTDLILHLTILDTAPPVAELLWPGM